MIQFKCSCCNQLLQLGDEWAGKVCKCPYSGQLMQVPGLAPAPVSAPRPAPARAPAANYYNPFEGEAFQAPASVAPPRRVEALAPEFGVMAGAVASDVQRQSFNKSTRQRWQSRGTLLGGAAGAALGLLFGIMFGVVASTTGGQTKDTMVAALSIIFGGAVLGAGVGGLIGPMALLIQAGKRDISTQGAVVGALYGTGRVAGFGALGGIVPGLLRGAFNLLQDGKVGEAVLATILTAILMMLAWAAIGAFVGAFFGGALGALGGYDS